MSIVPPDPDSKTDGPRDTIVSDLTRHDFGLWVQLADGRGGYLYAVHDYFNDGYPSRVLILVADDASCTYEPEFTDSDPAGYPKTMATPCVVALHPMGAR